MDNAVTIYLVGGLNDSLLKDMVESLGVIGLDRIDATRVLLRATERGHAQLKGWAENRGVYVIQAARLLSNMPDLDPTEHGDECALLRQLQQDEQFWENEPVRIPSFTISEDINDSGSEQLSFEYEHEARKFNISGELGVANAEKLVAFAKELFK